MATKLDRGYTKPIRGSADTSWRHVLCPKLVELLVERRRADAQLPA